MLYCLMAGMNVSEELADVLMHTAIAMIQVKQYRSTFKGKNGEGEIRTAYKYALLGGTIGGYEFTATIESDVGVRTVKYIVKDGDYEGIENGRWVTLPELLTSLAPQTATSSSLN